MSRFLTAVESVLEADAVRLETDFRALPGWCSLKAFGLLVMLENDFGAPVTIDRLRELKTVGDLELEALAQLAAKTFGVARSAFDPRLGYGETAEWDSVNHLRLVMAAEKLLGVTYPIETVPALRHLADFLR